jgi:hypothetical protein
MEISLNDVARYYKGLDHQIAALNWLQNKISAEVLLDFDKLYTPEASAEKLDPKRPESKRSFVDEQIKLLTQYCDGKQPNIQSSASYYSQRDNSQMPHRTCNSSSNAMYLDWLRRAAHRPGLGGDEDYLRTVLSIGDTIYHENQTAALKKYGFATQWRTDGDAQKVDDLLDAGFPVVVNILHRGPIESPRGGHVIMLCGRRKSEGTYISHDPYGTLGSGYTDTNGRWAPISPRSFKARWQGGYRVLT